MSDIRPIDAEELKEVAYKMVRLDDVWVSCAEVIRAIDNAPTLKPESCRECPFVADEEKQITKERPQGDLISREALIKKLEEMANNEWNIQVGSSKGLEDAIDVIENAPTVETDIEVATKDAYEHGYADGWKERFGEPDERPQDEWIPVSERLPDTDGHYLVTKDISAVSKDIFEVDSIEYSKESGEYNNGFWSSFSIIAWKPLPEPYKEGGAENER